MSDSPPHIFQSARWLGAVEGIHLGHVYGWAINALNPQVRVLLEVCHNGEPFGFVSADLARYDLMETFQSVFQDAARVDCCHGFVADIRGLSANEEVQLTVRVANTDHTLPGVCEVAAAQAPIARTGSFIYGDGGLRIHGWVVPAFGRAGPQILRAFVGTYQVATVMADIASPRARHMGEDVLGFVIDLPIELADGKLHSVGVVDQDGSPINGSPVQVCTYQTGGKALIWRKDKESQALLETVIDSYEQYLPRSLGLGHYRQWSKVFEPSEAGVQRRESHPPKGRARAKPRVGIVVAGRGSPADYKRTKASLSSLDYPDVQIFGLAVGHRQATVLGECLGQAFDAHCDVFACIRVGDTLHPQALYYALQGFDNGQVQVVYTDSEYSGRPWFKPAWNPEYAWASDYPLELMVMRADAVRSMLTPGAEPESAAELAWQMLTHVWRDAYRTIVHVPRVLYHFHSPLSDAELEVRLKASRSALGRIEPKSTLEPLPVPADFGLVSPRRLQRPLTKQLRGKSVSLIIPTRDGVELLQRCIASIQKHTHWENLEIIVIDNDSVQSKTKSYFSKLTLQGMKVLSFPGAFNFSAMNNQAVAAATGEIVGLINNDIEALHDGWLDEMVGHLLCPGVGAVGAKLLWPNDMVQHGGVLLGLGHAAGHFGNLLTSAEWGEHGRNQLVQQVSGVTAACLLVRKKDYLEVGGLDEQTFPVAFNDVDFCLKLRTKGLGVVWTPHACLLHAESASRGQEDTPQKKARAQRELQGLRARWSEVLSRDPAYHPSLSLDAHSQAFGGLALPPRDRAPRSGKLWQPIAE